MGEAAKASPKRSARETGQPGIRSCPLSPRPLGAEVDTGIREGAQGISPALTKISALDLQEFSTEDRDMIMETLTSLKNTLEEALAGATNPGRNLA
jgi:hypothetical protein